MKKKYKTGLVIGKFYPLHKGHEYLIRTAVNNCDKVWVMVCQTKKYKIPVEIRVAWVRELFPMAEVVAFKHSQRLDNDTSEVSAEWARIVIKRLGEAPEAVFSSEDYGVEFAKGMGSEHIMVDRAREVVPISARLIRADKDKYWDFLTEPAKEYLTKRIVVLGAESTGTTTLAMDLARYYQTTWVPEYGRTYYEGRMFAKENEKWSTDEFAHIMKMQNQMEDSLARKSNGVVICDTDSWTSRVWHKRYVGEWNKDLDKLTRMDNKSLYIVTDVDIPFVQDGTRDGEHLRDWMHGLFVRELKKTDKKYIVVSGSREERLKKSVDVIGTIRGEWEETYTK